MNILVVGHAYLAPINQQKWITYSQLFPHDNVTVVTPNRWSDGLFAQESLKTSDNSGQLIFTYFPIKHPGNEVRHSYRWRDVWHTIKQTKPDVMLVEQGDNSFVYFQFIVLALFLAPQAVRMFFTWINWKHPWGWKYKYFWSWIERFNLFFSDAAIVGNPEAGQLLKDKGFAGELLVSPQLGMEISEKSMDEHEHHRKRIGFVGRLVHEKGIALALGAFTQIAAEFPEWDFVIVGGGPQEAELKSLAAEHNLDQRVQFMGIVNHERAIELIKTFDLLVLPSYDSPQWKEQLGHVLLEAMALRVPILATNAGAIAWVVGDAGLIVEQKNQNALVRGLRTLCADDTLRSTYQERGYQRAHEHFSHQVIARNIAQFFRAVSQKTGSRA